MFSKLIKGEIKKREFTELEEVSVKMERSLAKTWLLSTKLLCLKKKKKKFPYSHKAQQTPPPATKMITELQAWRMLLATITPWRLDL